jgi:replicative DNA helicase
MDTNDKGSPLLGLSQRMPPSNREAEQALLGALLANNSAYDRISDFLRPEHFADEINGRIFEAIARRVGRGQVADAVTLKAEFEHTGVLEEVGGTSYLVLLVSAMVGIINVADYGRAIHDAWLRRQLIDIGETVVNNAFASDPDLNAKHQIEEAETALYGLAENDSERGFVKFERALTQAVEAADRAMRSSGGISGVTTGLRDLDKRLGGLHNSDLIIMAGRPGMGKSSLLTTIAQAAARSFLAEARSTDPAGVPRRSVAIFSLEMSAEQVGNRILADAAGISGDRIRRGDIVQRDFDKFVEASREIGSLPIFIDDTPGITLAALRSRCRRLKRTDGLALIMVDYLQLMRPSPGQRVESRVLEISMITQGLKALAKEINVPVIAASQLSRAVESRDDKRPQLADLRESGSIEQDSDVVLFIYRDEYYLKMREPKSVAFDNPAKYEDALARWKENMGEVHNKAELLIEKQRHGPTGTVKVQFDGEFTRFANLDQVHEDHF